MPAGVLDDLYWLETHGIKPWEKHLIPVDAYVWWPVISHARQVHAERERAAQERAGRSQPQGGPSWTRH